jgi:hypothetical protein
LNQTQYPENSSSMSKGPKIALLVDRSRFGYTMGEAHYASSFASRISHPWVKGP